MKTPYLPDPDCLTKVFISDDLSVQRIVVCAANRYGDLIICSARHHDKVMNSVLDALRMNDVEMARIGEQGFIDQYGLFLTREQAREVALSSGQRLRHINLSYELFSEDIY